MRTKLLVATRNAGKLREYSEMLASAKVEFVSLDEVGLTLEVEETGSSFADNAVLKAKAYAAASGLITLADDSGLEVDALNGAPGIYTARYGGEDLSPVQRYQYLLENLSGVPEERRSARFRCVIAMVGPDSKLYGTASGTCDGVIALAPKGKEGFGYDPVFLLPDYGRTMAELKPAEKHAISHRGRALKAISPLIEEIFS